MCNEVESDKASEIERFEYLGSILQKDSFGMFIGKPMKHKRG